jgi:hypothetical protein
MNSSTVEISGSSPLLELEASTEGHGGQNRLKPEQGELEKPQLLILAFATRGLRVQVPYSPPAFSPPSNPGLDGERSKVGGRSLYRSGLPG